MLKDKKKVMAVSFCLGAVMLVTTAFADVASGSGYDRLKDAVKFTAESCSEKLHSFTVDGTVTLKDGDKLLASDSFTQKIDNTKNASENRSSNEYAGGRKDSSYSYRDEETSISYDAGTDTYYVTEFTKKRDSKIFENPFKEERAEDMEKILDALVGNLKDYVVVEDKADGGKEFSGSLSEAQIPALVNAVTSFAFKQTFANPNASSEDYIPEISKDIFVKKISGNATVNKDGIMDSLFASGVLSGKDKEGNGHDLTLEVLFKISDINSTSVSKPQLEGKKVEKRTYAAEERTISQKFIGKYKNDIVILKDDKFIKIGERIVDITQVDGTHISGHYSEKFKEGYDEYAANKMDINFDAQVKDNCNAEFEYTNSSGNKETGNLSFNITNGKIYFHVNSPMLKKGIGYDSEFSMVFSD
ncbi:MAG: hypothetical protein QHH06_06220 [Clostridiales bacterium]|nr:hypothetical protein [Eubacteriales bacterium]MDH7566059.1 hypothetical protein [Clostridiales bacterium]